MELEQVKLRITISEKAFCKKYSDKIVSLFADKRVWKQISLIDLCQVFIKKLYDDGHRIICSTRNTKAWIRIVLLWIWIVKTDLFSLNSYLHRLRSDVFWSLLFHAVCVEGDLYNACDTSYQLNTYARCNSWRGHIRNVPHLVPYGWQNRAH